MNPIFKNTTKNSPKEYKKFAEFHGRKHIFSYLLTLFIVSAFFIFCSIIQFSSKHYMLGIFFILFLLAFIVYQIIHPLIIIKKDLKNGKISNKSKNTFLFFDKNFKVLSNDTEVIVKYRKLHKIYETDTFFYLYLNSTYAFLVSKNGFIIGNSGDFSNFIKKKVLFKYKKDKIKKVTWL